MSRTGPPVRASVSWWRWPCWIIVGLAALVAVIGVATSGGGDDVGAAVGIAMLTAVFGVIVAIPGTIVFNKCKRR